MTGGRLRVRAVSALHNDGDAQFLTFRGTLAAAVVSAFLGRWLHQTGKKLFLLLDHLRASACAAVQAWVADRRELLALPTYTPERNPVA